MNAVDLTGQTVGPYRVQAKIGEGGFAVVYRAVHEELGRDAALKVLKVPSGSDAGSGVSRALQRFNRESKLLAQLEHPGIVPVFDLGVHGDAPWFAMPFLSEPTLHEVIEAQRGKPLPPARAARIVSSLLDALHASHAQSVIHRDVKPSNVFVKPDGSVVLTDFGIAKTLDASTQLTGAGESLGTLAYAAPEQLTGEPVSPAADLYAVGLILYQLLVGRLPFGLKPSEIIAAKMSPLAAPGVSSGVALAAPLELVVMRAVEFDPAARFPDGPAFRAALGAALPRGSGSHARPGSGSTPRPRGSGRVPVAGTTPPRPRWRGAARALALLALVAAAGALGFVAGRRSPAREATPAAAPSSGASAAPAHQPIDTSTIPKANRVLIEQMIRMWPGYAPSPAERRMLTLLVDHDLVKANTGIQAVLGPGVKRLGERQLRELYAEGFFGSIRPEAIQAMVTGATVPALRRLEHFGELGGMFPGMSTAAEIASWLMVGISGGLEPLRRARLGEPVKLTLNADPRYVVVYLSLMRETFYEEVGGWVRFLLLAHTPGAGRADEGSRHEGDPDEHRGPPAPWTDQYRLSEVDRRIAAYFRAHPDPRD